MSENYIMIEGQRIELSAETMIEIKAKFGIHTAKPAESTPGYIIQNAGGIAGYTRFSRSAEKY